MVTSVILKDEARPSLLFYFFNSNPESFKTTQISGGIGIGKLHFHTFFDDAQHKCSALIANGGLAFD